MRAWYARMVDGAGVFVATWRAASHPPNIASRPKTPRLSQRRIAPKTSHRDPHDKPNSGHCAAVTVKGIATGRGMVCAYRGGGRGNLRAWWIGWAGAFVATWRAASRLRAQHRSNRQGSRHGDGAWYAHMGAGGGIFAKTAKTPPLQSALRVWNAMRNIHHDAARRVATFFENLNCLV